MTALDANAMRQQRDVRLAARASVGVALVLILAKGFGFFASGSTAMLGSLLDAVLDLVASSVTLVAVRTAHSAADREHRFGHGKAEALAALFQGALISGSALFLILEALRRVAAPQPVAAAPIGIAVSVLAIALALGLVTFQRRVARRTGSVAIAADSLHYASDLLLNLSVIAALVASFYFKIAILDPLFAIGIALYMLWNVVGLTRSSIDMLMDHEWSEAERQKIIALVLANSEVAGIHELRTRTSGTYGFIQFHISLAPQMPIADAHTISDEIEAVLGENYPDTEILIHIDPVGLVEHGQKQGYVE